MDDESGLTDGQRMVRRAQRVAMGLADTGLSQAEEMLRRVSPEGRARARREREARRRRVQAMMVRFAVAAVAGVLVMAGAAAFTPPVLAFALGVASLLLVFLLLQSRAEPAQVEAAALPAAELHRLPIQTRDWLAGQAPALPAPALPLADLLGRRLDELQPQLARVSPEEPAAEAVRKLIGTELPNLIEGWRGVPPSLRSRPRPDGRTPDAQLLDGLKLIDAEVARMTEQLSRGALDEVATQGRYLELKYRGEEGLS